MKCNPGERIVLDNPFPFRVFRGFVPFVTASEEVPDGLAERERNL